MRSGLLSLAVICCLAWAVAGQDGWRRGRGTFYGNEPWLWSIHEGSCGFGYIWPDEPLGWDVAALSDTHAEYSGSCGTCYEVKCDPMTFTDNYGNQLNREHVCKDPTQSVVVRITDTCPCNYADNLYSNKRWCCGDMDHFDLSVWAFEKLTDMRWGVLGLKYRPVPCDHLPANPAPAPANPFPGQPPPPGVSRPETPRFVATRAKPSEELSEEVPAHVPTGQIFEGNFRNEWEDSSWNSREGGDVDGVSGGPAICKVLPPGGALSLQGPGGFAKKTSLEFWVKTDNGVPDVKINVAGAAGKCRDVKLQDLTRSEGNENGFQRYDVYLGLFDRHDDSEVVAFAAEFKGCGGNSAEGMERIEFRNDLPEATQEVCLDRVQLLG